MATYDIEYGFEMTKSGLQLVIIVDNPTGLLTFDEFLPDDPYGTKPDHPSIGIPDDDDFHITVFVKASNSGNNPEKLIFAGTKFYFPGVVPRKHLLIYCAEKDIKGESYEKRRKRTATTVGSGSGGGTIQ